MEYICQENNTNVPHIQEPAKVQRVGLARAHRHKLLRTMALHVSEVD